ncbi:MAG: hypothetical protein M5R36_16520 [Deltaproteobacteria bacterium]|nr:hypothetical protein [Deltaproteobacteria bacterium]
MSVAVPTLGAIKPRGSRCRRPNLNDDTARSSEAVPVSLWEEDYSSVKAAVDKIKADGVVDLRAYFRVHPEVVDELVKTVRINDVNEETLRTLQGRDEKRVVPFAGQDFHSRNFVPFLSTRSSPSATARPRLTPRR